MENKKLDPYSYLFPLGIISGVIGALLWIFFEFKMIIFYPRMAHADIMYFGFLWSFIAGFLMTAIPKMTKTQSAHSIEIILAVGLTGIQWILNLKNLIDISYVIYAVQIFFLIIYVGRRFWVRRQIPFEGFVFVPFAFVVAIVGLMDGFKFFQSSGRWIYLWSGQAFVLNLICGVGSRLVPVLSRVQEAQRPDEPGNKNKYPEMVTLAVALNGSFVLETQGLVLWAYILRFAVVFYISWKKFKVFSFNWVMSRVGLGLRLSAGLMVVGYFSLIFNEQNPLPWQHLIFIGGFGLLTLMVATRVTVAHGGQSLNLEIKSLSLLLVILFLILSAVFRVQAAQNLNSMWLMTAVILFVVALLTWFFRFFKILFFISKSSN